MPNAKRYEIHHGDALAFLRTLPDASVDALITDGPYSTGGMVRGDRTATVNSKYLDSSSSNQSLTGFSGDNRDQRGFAYWCTLWLGECLRVTKPGAPVCLFSDWRQLPTTTDALQAGGFVWRGIVCWNKPTSRPCKGRFNPSCEYVVWGSNGPMPIEGECLPGFYTVSAPRKRAHVTQKPVDLMRSIVRICKPGGLILDPFLGAGTTGVAAMLEGRRIVGAELSRHFHQIATENIAAAASDG